MRDSGERSGEGAEGGRKDGGLMVEGGMKEREEDAVGVGGEDGKGERGVEGMEEGMIDGGDGGDGGEEAREDASEGQKRGLFGGSSLWGRGWREGVGGGGLGGGIVDLVCKALLGYSPTSPTSPTHHSRTPTAHARGMGVVGGVEDADDGARGMGVVGGVKDADDGGRDVGGGHAGGVTGGESDEEEDQVEINGGQSERKRGRVSECEEEEVEEEEVVEEEEEEQVVEEEEQEEEEESACARPVIDRGGGGGHAERHTAVAPRAPMLPVEQPRAGGGAVSPTEPTPPTHTIASGTQVSITARLRLD